MSALDSFISNLKSMNTAVKADYAAGKPWMYSNRIKKEGTFTAARNGNRCVACVDGVQWGLKGVVPDSALHWFGGKNCIVWTRTNGEAKAKEVFDIYHIGNKTFAQLMKEGFLKKGDIVTYVVTSHTNVYLSDKKCFDCGAREGSKFKKWIRNQTHKTYRVGYVLRLKDQGETSEYWVQAGAFTDLATAQKWVRKLNKKGFAMILRTDSDCYRIQAGRYKVKANAEKKVKALKKAGFDAFINEVKA